MDLNIVHAAQLLTLRGATASRRGTALRELSIVEDGAVSMRDGVIQWVGRTDQLPDRRAPDFDASGKIICRDSSTPTRTPFLPAARADEFEWRIEGTPYMDILARGAAYFQASRPYGQRADLRVRYAPKFFEYGTTTIEAKSGYGLNLETEVRMLEAMRATDDLEIVPTYLGAHAIPQEFRDDRDGFIRAAHKGSRVNPGAAPGRILRCFRRAWSLHS